MQQACKTVLFQCIHCRVLVKKKSQTTKADNITFEFSFPLKIQFIASLYCVLLLACYVA